MMKSLAYCFFAGGGATMVSPQSSIAITPQIEQQFKRSSKQEWTWWNII